MSFGFCSVAATSAVFSAVGGAVGGYFGGEPLAAKFAKVTGAVGAQIAIQKFTKEDSSISIETLRSQKGLFVLNKCLTQTTNVWSKIILCGYAVDMVMKLLYGNTGKYNSVCNSAFDSIHCASLEATTLSLKMMNISLAISANITIYDTVLLLKKFRFH